MFPVSIIEIFQSNDKKISDPYPQLDAENIMFLRFLSYIDRENVSIVYKNVCFFFLEIEANFLLVKYEKK